jgi:hypothetical protein
MSIQLRSRQNSLAGPVLIHRRRRFPARQLYFQKFEKLNSRRSGLICKCLIFKVNNIAYGTGNLLKPALLLALRAVKGGLFTTLSTDAVDIPESRPFAR